MFFSSSASPGLLAYNSVYLLQQLQLDLWILLEEQQHEEEADGQSVRCGDHHLQHTLSHILSRQFSTVLKTCTRVLNKRWKKRTQDFSLIL